VKYFLGENDRIKLLVLLSGETDDEALVKATLGTLAVLSSLHADIDAIQDLNLDDNDRQRLNEMVKTNREICEKIVDVRDLKIERVL